MKKTMLGYNIFDTAFGYAALLFQGNPFLVKRVLLPRKKKSTQRQTMERTVPAAQTKTEEAMAFCRKIQAYFDGIAVRFGWEHLDMKDLTPLQQLVLKTVEGIPYGSRQTYGQIAQRIGRPKACRFVGMTMHRNPFPVVIPCHRVVRSDGSLGGFRGGVTLKRRMLALEWADKNT